MENFKLYNHLGFHNPYYINNNSKLVIDSDFQSILRNHNDKTLDFSALVQILSKGYAFGDRTIIQGIKRTPWMAKPNKEYNAWDFYAFAKHQEKEVNEKEVASRLFHLLKSELIKYIDEHKQIGILLTGGMDSRIVAAVLKNALNSNNIVDKKITAFTWGKIDSRDVVYSQKIAALYNWDWKHLTVDKNQLYDNYQSVVENGCEFTPLHLHAMSKVTDGVSVECVLAGSFGDSIGRGEYSGVKVKNLTGLNKNIKNFGGILRDDFLEFSQQDTNEDIKFYHGQFPEEKCYQQFELDLQLHYMRRMLNPCMNLIHQKIPLYQMFSDPEVYQYIWSIHPDKRNDNIYKEILEMFAPELLDIPWARTGLKYPEKEGIPDKWDKRHHDYAKLIREDFFEFIEETINSNRMIAEKIFNFNNLITLMNNCKRYPLKNSFLYEEKLFWVAAVLEFIKTNDVYINLPEPKNKFYSSLRENLAYKVKYLLKKYRS